MGPQCLAARARALIAVRNARRLRLAERPRNDAPSSDGQQDFETSRSRHEREEKLIISAWYNMVSRSRPAGAAPVQAAGLLVTLDPWLLQGMALHQKVVGERSGSPGQAQSFLAQQRQATSARRSLSARLQHR